MISSLVPGVAAAGPADLSLAEPRSRPAIGILTGSGPEAGIDLWTKLLHENRRRLGPAFRGDIDAPAVHVVSDPALGLSMELERTEAQVWAALKADAQALDGRAAVYAIACNTLNLFADRLHALALRAQLLSFTEVVGEHLKRSGAQRVCLLGARPVAELGDWSPYRALRAHFDFEPLGADATEALHQLIYDIKWRGAAHPGLRERFAALLAGIKSPMVLLACTELPLVAELPGDERLVDVTQLVAEALLDRTDALAASSQCRSTGRFLDRG